MNKTGLIEGVAQEAKVPTSEAHKHFEALERVVTEALKGGEEVRITGFGKFFCVQERKAREGRDPRTGQKIEIAARRVPAFSAGDALTKRRTGSFRAGAAAERAGLRPFSSWVRSGGWSVTGVQKKH